LGWGARIFIRVLWKHIHKKGAEDLHKEDGAFMGIGSHILCSALRAALHTPPVRVPANWSTNPRV
jgi:hypothetical protein